MSVIPPKISLLDRVAIEPMVAEDLDQVMEIEEASYRWPWSRQSFEAELDRSASTSLILREFDQIVGFLIFWMVQGEIHILNLAIRPDKRRLGLAGFFLEYLFEWGREFGAMRIFLEVRVSNHGARALYERLGFFTTGRRKNYYSQEKEDALLMVRYL